MKLTDTHCHLYFETYQNDLDQVIRRAEEAGVEKILVPAIDLASCREALRLADLFPLVRAAVGIHPNSGKSWTAGTLAELRELAGHPRVVAIGEIGLDYYRNHAPGALQREILVQQLALARELSLPVILHMRNRSEEDRSCVDDLLQILESWRDGGNGASPARVNPGVIHSFSGTAADARRALEAGFLIGVTGAVTFNNARQLRDLVASIGLGKLLVETDGPFITPHPFRGKRNEPAHVRYIVDKISEVKGLDPGQVAEQTAVNANLLFEWE